MTSKMLRHTRKLLGLTLHDLSRMTRIHVSALSLMERGRQKIRPQHREFLATALRTDCLKRIEELKERSEELK